MFEANTPWIQRKYLALMGKWCIVWTIATAPAIALVRVNFGTDGARTIIFILSMITVGQFFALFLMALLRIGLPQKWFKQPRESPNTDYLRSVGIVVGVLLGSVLGLAAAWLFC